jgi:hypothetical protein
VRFATLLKIVLLTSGIGFLAATYGIRTARHYRADDHAAAEQSCESKSEEQEAESKPAVPPDEQRGCWSDLDSDLNWESIGR